MRTFHIAQVHIHRDASLDSDVQPTSKNLVMLTSALEIFEDDEKYGFLPLLGFHFFWFSKAHNSEIPYWILCLGLWSPRRQVPPCWLHICVATCPLHPLVRRQVSNEGIKKSSTYLPTGLRFLISGVIFSWATAPKFCKTNRLFPLIEVDWPILSRPSAIVFIDDDNYSASGICQSLL